MNNAYRSLMKHQHLSDQAKQTVYNNLHSNESNKPKFTFLKVAVVATCIMLMIPMTVLAVESIFSIARFDLIENATIDNQPGVGYTIRFDTIQNHPITDFSEHLQNLEQTTVVSYDSWDEAEEDLGIDLISNSILSDGETEQILPYVPKGTPQTPHCEGVYLVADGQLYASHISAVYKRSRVNFMVSAQLTAEHPTIGDEELQCYHGIELVGYQEDDPSFTTEQYTTKNGIPMIISIAHADDSIRDGTGFRAGYTDFRVAFAVDNISYEVWVCGCEGAWNDSHIYTVLCEVLEGFTF